MGEIIDLKKYPLRIVEIAFSEDLFFNKPSLALLLGMVSQLWEDSSGIDISFIRSTLWHMPSNYKLYACKAMPLMASDFFQISVIKCNQCTLIVAAVLNIARAKTRC